jgi:hypothetical protein
VSRVNNMRCATCLWWEEGASLIATEPKNPTPKAGFGACITRAPVPVATSPGRVDSVLPGTAADFLCGEWEPAEDGVGDGAPTVIPFRRPAA